LGNGDQVEVTKEVKTTMAEHAGAFSTHDVLRMMKAFNAAAVDTRGGWQPSLSLELAVAEVLEEPVDVPVLRQEEKQTKAKKADALAQRSVTKSEPEKAKVVKPAEQKTEPEKKSVKSAEDVEPKAKVEAPAIGLAEVTKVWRDIRSIIKPEFPALDGLLNSCKPLEIRGDELILGFASDVLVKKMDQPRQIEATRKAIAEVLGVDLSIKCVVANAKGQLPSDVNPDGMVAAAIRNGGEIVDIQD
jgi:DNA polymerase-3 subunit gamma/tau